MRNMGATSVRSIERALREWGLHLGMQIPRYSAPSSASWSSSGNTESAMWLRLYAERCDEHHPARPEEVVKPTGDAPVSDVYRPDAKTVKDELLHAMTQLLAKAGTIRQFHCFVAYFGVDGAPRRTLAEIGDEGRKYGFDRAVTRERIRQLRSKAERKLRRDGHRVRFAAWKSAVDATKSRLPAPVHSFVSSFGYVSPPNPTHVFSMLELCADIFRLDFPFEVRTLDGLGPLVVDRAASAEFEALTRLREVASGPYAELTNVVQQLGCEEDSLRRMIEANPQWEFLDDAGRYFWRRPLLPPRNYGKTGNPILTTMCKVFSVTRQVSTSDLSLSVIRDRMLRKNGLLANVPAPVMEGIAARSGLFDVRDGEILRKAEFEWCTIGQRDMALLSVCVEYGRIVPSYILYSRLVQYGLGQENAAVTVAYSPFLVHTQSGVGHKEGIYKFVLRREEIDLEALETRVDSGSRECNVEDYDAEPDVWMRIPISSRVRLSGRYFDPATTGLDGTWKVQDETGTEVGRVRISEGTVNGLKPVIDALGLGKDDVLVLQHVESERSLVAVA